MAQKLPILELTLNSYRLPIISWLYALKISWFWCVLYFAFTNFLYSQSILVLPDFSGHYWEQVLFYEIVFIAETLLYAIAWGSIVVLWHRHVLLLEHRGGVPIQFNRRVFCYIIRFVLIWIVVLLASLPLLLLLNVPEFPSGTSESPDLDELERFSSSLQHIWFLFGFVFALIFGRLGVALPAIAIDHRSFGLSAAWSKTAGNSLRIALIGILTTWPFLLLEILVSEVFSHFIFPVPIIDQILETMVSLVCYLASVLVGVTFLSLAYAFLVEDRSPDSVLG